jgi:tol-pal system protein YbgF
LPVAGDEAPDTSREPVVRVVGGGKHVELTVVTDTAPPASEAQREYDRALAFVNGHDYDHGIEALGAFLARYPDDGHAEAALYWKAECYLAKGEFGEAADEFEATLARFPKGSKTADCLFALGSCADRLGNREKSKAYYERLTREYPKSDAARRLPAGRS